MTKPALPAISLLVGALLAQGAQAELSASVLALAKTCAPDVAPETLGYLVSHESMNNPFNLNVNEKGYVIKKAPTSKAEAMQLIEELEREGRNYDVGYGQINSGNFEWLGVTAESLLDGCNNLRASSKVLAVCYRRAVNEFGEGQQALRHALSCYNTGSLTKGFENGYVAKVVAQANNKIPALLGDAELTAGSPDETHEAETAPQTTRPLGTPDAFAAAPGDAFSHSDPDAFQAAQESPE